MDAGFIGAIEGATAAFTRLGEVLGSTLLGRDRLCIQQEAERQRIRASVTFWVWRSLPYLVGIDVGLCLSLAW